MNPTDTAAVTRPEWFPSATRGMVLALAFVLASGCARKVEFKSDAIDEEMAQFNRDAWNSFEHRRFGELEAVAAQAIKERAIFGTGSWKITQLHWAITPPSEGAINWKWYDEHIRDWEAKYPQSVTAHIVHAQYYTAFAWNARGGEDSDKVKPDAWPLFEERLGEANKQLAIASRLAQKSPMFWHAGFTVALGQGWPKEAAIKWFKAAKEAYPDYWGFDAALYQFLLPRWYGEEGEWEKMALEEIKRPGGLAEEGYARAVLGMEMYHKNVFKETKADWQIVKTGFLQMREKYPTSKLILNQFAFVAILAEDRQTAMPLFKEIGVHPDPGVWGSVAQYKDNRNWVNGGRY